MEPYTFETKESNEAAFLWAQPEIDIVRAIPKKRGKSVSVYFIMSSPLGREEVERLRTSYYNGKTKVNPHEFVQRQHDIKTLIYQTLDKYNGEKYEKSRA